MGNFYISELAKLWEKNDLTSFVFVSLTTTHEYVCVSKRNHCVSWFCRYFFIHRFLQAMNFMVFCRSTNWVQTWLLSLHFQEILQISYREKKQPDKGDNRYIDYSKEPGWYAEIANLEEGAKQTQPGKTFFSIVQLIQMRSMQDNR
jgi:hypothetical protein